MKTLLTLALLLLALPCYSADLPLAWDARSEATGYKLQISTDMGATWGEIRDAGNVQTYTWLGAPDTGLVLWRVSAYNATGEAWGTTKGAWYCGSWLVPPPAVGLGAR